MVFASFNPLGLLTALAVTTFPVMAVASPAHDARDFCYKAAQRLENHLRLGRDPSGQAHALAAANQLIEQWRQGNQNLYLPNELFRTPILKRGLIPVSRIIRSGLDLNTDPVIIYSADELRFIPFSQAGLDIVLIAQQASFELDDQKSQAVIAVAQRNNLRIHIIGFWDKLDTYDNNSQAARLASVSALTSGRFVNLQFIQNHCES